MEHSLIDGQAGSITNQTVTELGPGHIGKGGAHVKEAHILVSSHV